MVINKKKLKINLNRIHKISLEFNGRKTDIYIYIYISMVAFCYKDIKKLASSLGQMWSWTRIIMHPHLRRIKTGVTKFWALGLFTYEALAMPIAFVGPILYIYMYV